MREIDTNYGEMNDVRAQVNWGEDQDGCVTVQPPANDDGTRG